MHKRYVWPSQLTIPKFMHSKKLKSLYSLNTISENHDIGILEILQIRRLQVLTNNANNGHELCLFKAVNQFQISKTSSKYKSAPSKSKSSRWRHSGILALLLI